MNACVLSRVVHPCPIFWRNTSHAQMTTLTFSRKLWTILRSSPTDCTKMWSGRSTCSRTSSSPQKLLWTTIRSLMNFDGEAYKLWERLQSQTPVGRMTVAKFWTANQLILSALPSNISKRHEIKFQKQLLTLPKCEVEHDLTFGANLKAQAEVQILPKR